MKHGEHDFDSRLFLAFMDVDGDAAAVVGDGDAVIGVDGDVDGVSVAGERFVDGVINDFVDEVVKAPRAHITNVHCGALTNRLDPFEDLNVLGTITGGDR